MDLSTINDVTVLKAMAYDQIAAKEEAERSLSAINQRILEVLNESMNKTDKLNKEEQEVRAKGEK